LPLGCPIFWQKVAGFLADFWQELARQFPPEIRQFPHPTARFRQFTPVFAQ